MGIVVFFVLASVGLFCIVYRVFRIPPRTHSPEHTTRNTQHEISNTLLVVLWWLIPTILIFALGLYKEAYLKFLLASSPAFCLLSARGIVIAWRAGSGSPGLAGLLWRMCLVLLVVSAAIFVVRSLYNLYFDPAFARDDYRGIARYVQRDARPGDAILLEAPNQWEAFTYYHRDYSNVIPIGRVRPVTAEMAAHDLSEITARYRRLFVLYWAETEPDPYRYVERWLSANTYKASEAYYGTVRLAVYAVPAAASDQPQHTLDIRFGDSIQLQGYSLFANVANPGDIVQLALFWQAQMPIARRYKVFIHVLDASDHIVTQVDREPGGGLVPTTIWQPGQVIIDRYGIAVPSDVQPGRYRILIGLYDFEGARLSVRGTGEDRVILSEVIVAR